MKNRTHRCDTDNPMRPCCWAARKAELEAMRDREKDPKWLAEKAEDDDRKADSFVAKGID